MPYVETISNYFSVRSMKNMTNKDKKPSSPKAKKTILTKHPSLSNSNVFFSQLKSRDLNETYFNININTKSPFVSCFEEETPSKTAEKSFERPDILTNFSHYDTFSATHPSKNLEAIPSPSFNEKIEAAAREAENTQPEINTGNTEEAYSSRQMENM